MFEPNRGGLVLLDQLGFIPSREARDNTLKTFSVIIQVRTSNTPCIMLYLETKKVFDQVNWVFLRAVLTNIGLGPIMLQRIFALYHQPTAQIRVNKAPSQSFRV